MNKTAHETIPAAVESAPPGHPLLRQIKDLLLALSLANLCFIRPWFGLLFDVDYGYLNKVRVTSMTLLALTLNIALLTLLFWLAATWVRRTPNVWIKRLAALGLCAVFLVPLNFVRLNHFGVPGKTVVGLSQNPLVIASGVLLAILVLRSYRAAARTAAAILVIMLPLSFFTLGKIALLLLNIVSLAQHSSEPVLVPLQPNPKMQPRVVWLLFDELDERVVFAERPVGLQLPELDRLRQGSLFATNAYPPASDTVMSLPALTTGLTLSDAMPTSASELKLVLADTNKTAYWSTHSNVFSRARELGYNTALVGWYHPYGRVLAASLNYCAWYPFPHFEQSRGRTFGENLLNQIWATVSPLQLRRLQVKLYQQTLQDSLNVVTNSQYGFVFLHLPGPHKPGIYVPARHRFTLTHFSTVGGYLDNLVLTDETLGILRRAMEASSMWDNTWLLVTSDHFWREAPTYDGRIDYRVPFILKAPGNHPALIYPSAFNTVITQDLLLAILRGEIASPEAVVAWLDKQERGELPDYKKITRNH